MWSRYAIPGLPGEKRLSRLTFDKVDLYKFISLESSKKKLTITDLCLIFKVSRSSYYYSLNSIRKAVKDQKESAIIKAIPEKSPEYGYRRIAIAAGFSENKTYRLMKKLKIKSKIRKRRYYRYPAAKKSSGIVSKNLV